jgi:molybdopterin molybdotransferase
VRDSSRPPSPPEPGHHSGEQLLPVARVLDELLTGRIPLTPAAVSLRDALGCVLAEPLVASLDLPPFACSAMDGYAVRSRDLTTVPVELRVIGATMAGDGPGPELHAGEAVRVMTGAPVPPGADAVVMIERSATAGGPDRVLIEHAPTPGELVRPAGDDVRSGDVVFGRGEVLGPAHLGIAAGLGRVRVVVHPRPRVGVLSTGDELFEGTGALRAGTIRDSNGVSLAAALAQSGCVPVDLGVVGDETDAVVKAIEAASRDCDAVLTTGGVSVGDRDVVKHALGRIEGAVARQYRIAVRPGKPFAFAELPGSCLVFALPGNPVSAMVAFELLVRPVLRRMGGHARLHRPAGRAVADEALPRRPDGRLHLFRSRVHLAADGRLHVVSAGAQGSHQLSAMAGANALALLPDGDGVAAGREVEVLLLDAGELPGDVPPELGAAGDDHASAPAAPGPLLP